MKLCGVLALWRSSQPTSLLGAKPKVSPQRAPPLAARKSPLLAQRVLSLGKAQLLSNSVAIHL